MRTALAVMAILGCATVSQAQRTFREPHWPDTEATREAIRCAVATRHGERIAEIVMRVQVVETDDPPLREYLDCATCQNPRIVLDAAERMAIESPWRHVVFAHLVPAAIGLGWNLSHSNESANRVEAALRMTVRECWVKAIGVSLVRHEED